MQTTNKLKAPEKLLNQYIRLRVSARKTSNPQLNKSINDIKQVLTAYSLNIADTYIDQGKFDNDQSYKIQNSVLNNELIAVKNSKGYTEFEWANYYSKALYVNKNDHLNISTKINSLDAQIDSWSTEESTPSKEIIVNDLVNNKESLESKFTSIDKIYTDKKTQILLEDSAIFQPTNIISSKKFVNAPVIVENLQELTPTLVQTKGVFIGTTDPIGAKIPNQTILKVGDLFDPRQIEYIKPLFRHGTQEPAYFYISSTKILKDKRLPSLSHPFGNNYEYRYNQFSITTVSEVYTENYQLADTVDTGVLLTVFGRKPEIWTFSGVLLNDYIHEWMSKMREVWHHDIRASQLLKKRSYLIVVIPSVSLIIECYPIGLTMTVSAQNPTVAIFNMAYYVRHARTSPSVNIRSSTYTLVDDRMIASIIDTNSIEVLNTIKALNL